MNKARVSGIALQYVPSQVSNFPQLLEGSKTLLNFFFLPEKFPPLIFCYTSICQVHVWSPETLYCSKKVTDQTDG